MNKNLPHLHRLKTETAVTEEVLTPEENKLIEELFEGLVNQLDTGISTHCNGNVAKKELLEKPINGSPLTRRKLIFRVLKEEAEAEAKAKATATEEESKATEEENKEEEEKKRTFAILARMRLNYDKLVELIDKYTKLTDTQIENDPSLSEILEYFKKLFEKNT